MSSPIYVYDPDTLEPLDIIENAAVIWERKVSKPGTFQLTIQGAMNLEEEQIIVRGIQDGEDENNSVAKDAAVIESIRRTYTQAGGHQAVITGRFLSSYIARRVINGTKTITGTYEYIMKKLVTDYMTAAAGTDLAFANLVVAESHGYESEIITYQETDKKLIDEMEKLSTVSKLGFGIKFVDGTLVFDVYKGTDRTKAQETNSQVIFSVLFENVLSQAYSVDTTDLTTVAYIKMPAIGETPEIRTKFGTATGRNRREILVTGTDVTKNEEGTPNSQEVQLALLKQQGEGALTDKTLAFESTIDPNAALVYGEDYTDGDFVTLEADDWGISLDAQITAARVVEENGKESLKLTFGYDGFSFKKILQRMVT